MENFLSIFLALPLALLIIKKPVLGIYLFLIFSEIENYTSYLTFFEVIVPITADLNKYIIFILFYVVIKKNNLNVKKINQIKPLLFFLFLFFIWSGSTLLWTSYNKVVMSELNRLLTFLIMSFAIYLNINDSGQLEKIIVFYLRLILLKLVIKVSLYLFYGIIIPVGSAWIYFPICFYTITNNKYLNREKIVSYLIIFFSIISTISVPQRRDFLSFFIISGLSIFFLTSNIRKTFIYIVTIALLIIVSVGFYANDKFYYKIRQTKHAATNFDTSWTGRAALWTMAAQKIKKRPLTGYGYGTNNEVLYDASVEYGIAKGKYRMHNAYLKVITELGLVGFFIYMGIVILLLRYFYFSFKMFFNAGDYPLFIYSFSLFCNWVSKIITSTFGYSSYYDKDFYVNIIFAIAFFSISSQLTLINKNYN
jgi:O-antigen ligase